MQDQDPKRESKTPAELTKFLIKGHADLEKKREEAQKEIEGWQGDYTPDDVNRWKSLGIQMPEFVSSSDWKVSGPLTANQRLVCHLAAIHLENKAIVRTTHLEEGYVSKIINSKIGAMTIDQIQSQLFSEDYKKSINKVMPLAIKQATKDMMDPNNKGSTRVDAAFKFMDRVLGKPVQQIEMKDTTIRGVYEYLDKMAKGEAIEVQSEVLTEDKTPVTVEEDRKEKDPVDEWVEGNLK